MTMPRPLLTKPRMGSPGGGWQHFCAVRDAGDVSCGGRNDLRQAEFPVWVSGSVVQVDVAVSNTNGRVWFGDQATRRIALVGWDDTACEGTFYGVRALSVPELDMATVCALTGQPAIVEVTVSDLLASDPAPVTEVLEIAFELDPKDDAACM